MTYQTLIPNQLYNLTGATVISDGFSLNTFALVKENRVLLMDAVIPLSFPALAKLLQDNPEWKIKGCIISHRHVAGITKRAGFTAFFDTFGRDIPLILPDFESQNHEALDPLPDGIEYVDPANNPTIEFFGFDVTVFPGHTEAHPWYYWRSQKILMVGDCAVGPNPRSDYFTRPPVPFSLDDKLLKKSWEKALKKGLGQARTVCAFHGGSVVNKEADELKLLVAPLGL
jgi:glyoxylase-like metal-dependent hydrolase (beta-lactamase superfamily II)